MTVLSISTFGGEIPRLPADRLPDGAAQFARNCDFAHGELRSLAGLGAGFVAGLAPVRGLFTDNGLRFFVWDKPTRAYLHPTIDDTAGRMIYQSHGLGVRVALLSDMKLSGAAPTAPTQSWKVGVKRPAAVISATVSGTPLLDDVETVSYVAVAINQWGEESAPSDPVLVDKKPGQTVALSIAHAVDPDEYPLQGIVFYRTYVSNQSADFYLLNSTPLAGADGVYSFNDTTDSTTTTTTLETESWDVVPAAAGNLTYMGNGFFVASSGKDLVFSEPYRPHAWPYRMTLPHGIVGVVAVEGGALVTTQAQSYTIAGAHPEQVSQTLLPVDQAGWSDTAIARVKSSAVYAGNDGLVDLFGGQPSIEASQQLFTRRDWRAAYGDVRLNLRLAAHDGRVLGFVDPNHPIAAQPSRGPFLIDLEADGGAFCRMDLGQPIYGTAVSATTDELYVGTATGAAPFGEGAELPLVWQSGDYRYPAAIAFAAARIHCAGSFTVEIYADDVLVQTQAVTGDTRFRLPPTKPAERWSVKISGTGAVRRVQLASSFAELKGSA